MTHSLVEKGSELVDEDSTFKLFFFKNNFFKLFCFACKAKPGIFRVPTETAPPHHFSPSTGEGTFEGSHL